MRQKIKEFLLSNLVQDILVPLVMVILLAILANPLGSSYSQALMGATLLALVLTFALSTFLYWQETKRENEDNLPVDFSFPDRIAFFAVAVVLLAGVAVQSLLGVLDVWLAIALVVLVIAKVWGRIYSQLRG